MIRYTTVAYHGVLITCDETADVPILLTWDDLARLLDRIGERVRDEWGETRTRLAHGAVGFASLEAHGSEAVSLL